MALKYYGKAGSSMGTQAFKNKYASTSSAGLAGEQRVLQLLGTMTDGETIVFSSVKTPHPKYHTDIDFVLLKGNKVLLVDAKRYKQGGFWFSFRNILYRNFQVAHRDKNTHAPSHMSRNMAMAKRVMQEKLGADYVVEGVVVFSRDNNTRPHSHVWFVNWDGIRSVNEAGLPKLINRFFRGATNSQLTEVAERFIASNTQ